MVLAENDSEALACLLEDRLAAEGTRRAFLWPVWRFGRVLEPKAGNKKGLSVEQAKAVGTLFRPDGPSFRRYFTERLAHLGQVISEAGGKLLASWDAIGNLQSPALLRLRQKWGPGEKNILITYSFVPIVRFADRLVSLGGGLWHLRESITVCGYPSKSKVWLTMSLVAWKGNPADESALSRRELGEARSVLEGVRVPIIKGLLGYYQDVLICDSRSLSTEEPISFSEFGVVAETEIVSMTSAVGAEAAFSALEARGLNRFKSEAATSDLDGVTNVLDFLTWGSSSGSAAPSDPNEQWEAGRPKVLSVYAENPSCGSARALVVPHLSARSHRTWYGALVETLLKPDWKDPLSESACRFLAREYGRYF